MVPCSKGEQKTCFISVGCQVCVSTLIFFFLGVKFSGTSSIGRLWTLNGMAPYVNLMVFFMIIQTCHCVGLRSLAAKQKNTKQLSFLLTSPSEVRSLLDKIWVLLKKQGNHGALQRILPFPSLLLCTGTNNCQRLSGQKLRLIIHSGQKRNHILNIQLG